MASVLSRGDRAIDGFDDEMERRAFLLEAQLRADEVVAKVVIEGALVRSQVRKVASGRHGLMTPLGLVGVQRGVIH